MNGSATPEGNAYPEVWAATYAAAWVAYPGAGIAMTDEARRALRIRRAEWASAIADDACQGLDDLIATRNG